MAINRSAIQKELRAFKQGNPRVKSRKQAIAIAINKDKKKNRRIKRYG